MLDPLYVEQRQERRASHAPDRRNPSHLDGFIQAQFGARRKERAQDRACTHWPLDGMATIQAASRALLAMAELWEHGKALARSRRVGPLDCIDVAAFGAGPPADVMLLRAAAVPDEIRAIQLSMRTQAGEFERISTWLVGSARAARLAARVAGRPLGMIAVLSEDHRVIAKDLVASDMNSLIANLLGQAIKVLECLNLEPEAIESDLLGAGSYGVLLHSAAEMLDRARVFATESECFVEDLDRRWWAFRDQIATVTALSRDAVGTCRKALHSQEPPTQTRSAQTASKSAICRPSAPVTASSYAPTPR